MLPILLSLVAFAGVPLPQQPDDPAPKDTAAIAAAPSLVHTIVGQCRGHDPAAKKPVRVSLWLHDYHKESATLVRDVQAKADGSFTLADVAWLADFDWGFAFFVLEARQGDRISFVLLRGVDAARGVVDVELATAITIKGSVRANNRDPIAGAEVRLQGVSRGESWLFFAETPPPLIAHSAADGTFAIRGVPPGYRYTISTVAEGFARGRIDSENTDEFRFELGPGGTLTGRVVDEQGKPQVRVRVCTQGVKQSFWATARTDDQGQYELPGLVDDAYNVWADVDGATCVALDSQAITLGERTAAPDLVALPGGFFVGRVLDADTQQPVLPGAAADVAVYGPSRPRSGAACDISPIAADGTFRIRVPPGSNYIYLRAGPGFEAVTPSSFTLDIATGAEQTIEFRVKKSTAVHGHGPGR